VPTEQDLAARRRAERGLATAYGWPEAEPELRGWRKAAAWSLVLGLDLATLVAIVAIVAFVTGIWRL
jgi:hypothetical protein